MNNVFVLKSISLFILFFLIGCTADTETPDDERIIQTVDIEFDQKFVVPSSVLTFRLRGTDRIDIKGAKVKFISSTEYEQTVTSKENLKRVNGDHGDVIIELPVEEGFWARTSGNYNGIIEVTLFDGIGDLAIGTLNNIFLEGVSDVTPFVDTVPGGTYFVNESIEVQGANFLRPEEGTTWATVSGRFTPESNSSFDVAQVKIPVVWNESRKSANFFVDPKAFGVQLGRFSGQLSFQNELRTGEVFVGNQQADFQFEIQQSLLAKFAESSGSRGQRIDLIGRGFVGENLSDDRYGMVLIFEGTFEFNDGTPTLDLTGSKAIRRPPDSVTSDQSAVISVWYDVSQGELSGIGAKPGLFKGTVTPLLIDERGEQLGFGWTGEFRVLPTKQMVFIKYLPGFSKALEKYGISNVEFEIRKKILSTTNRDYKSVNVEFVEEPPSRFIDFATIEVGGPDPTGMNKFGYDNTCNVQEDKCKDTDNLYLADYLGGLNSNSAAEYNTLYGGVFIESFDYFSQQLTPTNKDASPDFDRILGPFMRDLGGDPVLGTEYPGGDRDIEIGAAINLVSAVIANTVTHEVGHSLGLTFTAQDRLRASTVFHNQRPCDWCIMNSGSNRPFEQRGELVEGIPIFNALNQEYLNEILPLPSGL